MSSHRRLKRPRLDIELETVSKYFKNNVSMVSNSDQNEDKYEVDIDKIKSMNSKEYFDFIENRTNDDILDEFNFKDSSLYPKNFLSIYSKVRLMRSKIDTPVDSVGCAIMPITISEKFGISKYDISPKNYRFQLLVALMMSSQTKDEFNANALYNLMDYSIRVIKSKMGFNLEILLDIEEATLSRLIHSVGFYRKKTVYLKKAAYLLLNEFGGDVPTSIEGFCSIPGVGPKMGYLALQKSWGMIVGIGVDVHVDRLSKMWKWVDAKTCKTPEYTRKALESWLPQELWYEINPVLVGFGQVICSARGRRCDICLANTVCNNVDRKIVKTRKLDINESHKRGNHNRLLVYLKDLQDAMANN